MKFFAILFGLLAIVNASKKYEHDEECKKIKKGAKVDDGKAIVDDTAAQAVCEVTAWTGVCHWCNDKVKGCVAKDHPCDGIAGQFTGMIMAGLIISQYL